MGHEERQAYERNLRLYYVFQALINLVLFVSIWVVYLQEQRGLTLGQVAALEAFFSLATVLLEVPTGVIADRWGRKQSLCAGALCYAVGLFLLAVAGSYPLVVVAYTAWAAALALVSGADSALLYDTLKALGRTGEYTKIHGRASGIAALALMLGSVAGSALAGVTTLATPILLNAALLLIAFALALRFREPQRFEEHEAQAGHLGATARAAAISWRAPLVRYVLIVSAITMATHTLVTILGQPYLREHGVGVGLLGLLLVPSRLAGVFGSLAAHRFVAVLGERLVIVLAPVSVVATVVALAVFDSAWAVAALPLGGLALAVGRTVYSAYLNDRIPSSYRATIMSFQRLLMSLAIVAILPLSGMAAERSNVAAAYGLTAAITAVAITAGIILWLRAGGAEDRAAPPSTPVRA